ncbi:MAG: DUF6125 family protein [Spirochaetota bacterium]|jgi:hypothetical protein
MLSKKLTSEQKENLLRDIWILHDGRWFLKTVEKIGYTAATDLNLSVVKSFAKTEINKLMAELNLDRIHDIGDLKYFIEIATDLYFPKENKFYFEILNENNLLIRMSECYVHTNVSKSGFADLHQCAGKIRCDSWIKALNLVGETHFEKNTNNCNGTCDIIFDIKW